MFVFALLLFVFSALVLSLLSRCSRSSLLFVFSFSPFGLLAFLSSLLSSLLLFAFSLHSSLSPLSFSLSLLFSICLLSSIFHDRATFFRGAGNFHYAYQKCHVSPNLSGCNGIGLSRLSHGIPCSFFIPHPVG